MITTVIFDLSEVLLTGVKDTGIGLAKNLALEISKEHTGHHGDLNPFMVPAVWEFFNGRMSEDDYLTEVLRIYPTLATQGDLKALIRANFREIEGTRAIIENLRTQGYRLGLLSVHAKEWIDHCEPAHGLNALFDEVSYSYEVGVSKPHTDAFMHLVGRLKASPEDCLFVDDSKINVAAATSLGLTGILFTEPAGLEDDLVQLLPNYRRARMAIAGA